MWSKIAVHVVAGNGGGCALDELRIERAPVDQRVGHAALRVCRGAHFASDRAGFSQKPQPRIDQRRAGTTKIGPVQVRGPILIRIHECSFDRREYHVPEREAEHAERQPVLEMRDPFHHRTSAQESGRFHAKRRALRGAATPAPGYSAPCGDGSWRNCCAKNRSPALNGVHSICFDQCVRCERIAEFAAAAGRVVRDRARATCARTHTTRFHSRALAPHCARVG